MNFQQIPKYYLERTVYVEEKKGILKDYEVI